MSEVQEKVCILCRHFDCDGGSPGYSEYTPPVESTIECRKKKWKLEWYTQDEYREKLLTAETCEDYIHWKEND